MAALEYTVYVGVTNTPGLVNGRFTNKNSEQSTGRMRSRTTPHSRLKCPWFLWGCSMVHGGKNIANGSKNTQFPPIMRVVHKRPHCHHAYCGCTMHAPCRCSLKISIRGASWFAAWTRSLQCSHLTSTIYPWSPARKKLGFGLLRPRGGLSNICARATKPEAV